MTAGPADGGGGGRSVVIVVDDLRTFAFDAVHARSSAAGIEVLQCCLEHGHVIDELWLDYNLGRGDTGRAVVSWLLANLAEAKPLVRRVYVHSSDPVGARMMIAALSAAGIAVARRFPGEPGAELR
jgi:hypothetical protein